MKLHALNGEKNLGYLNERINIIDELKNKNISNAHFLNSPLLGVRTGEKISELIGLYITLTPKQIQFWVITPNQYFNIFNISLQIDGINKLLKESLSTFEIDDRKQNLRKYLFVEPDSINSNAGVIQNSLENLKFDELVNLDFDINHETLALLDKSQQILIYK